MMLHAAAEGKNHQAVNINKYTELDHPLVQKGIATLKSIDL